MEQTPNYHLNKPARSEKVNVDLLNQNMDIVDRELNNTSNNLSSTLNGLNSHVENKTNPHNVTKKQLGLENVENKSSSTIRGEITKANVTNALGYTPYTPNEIDNKFSTLETKIDWKEAVNAYADIASTYPSPEDGWTVNVKDTDYTYRYNGEKWVAISANAIPKATSAIDGLLSKEDYANFSDSNSKKHTHSNKTILDGITSDLINKWNNTVSKSGDTMSGNLTVPKLNSYDVNSANTFNRLATIQNNGVMEVGRYFDFHYASGESNDYSARLEVTGQGSNQLKMNGNFQVTSNLIVGNDIQLNGMEYVGKIGWNESGTRDDGWDVIADIKITSSYTDSPLVFEVVHRHGQTPMEISVLFAATSTADPTLQSFTYQGSNYDARIWKTTTSTWRLAVKRSESADEQIITRFIKQTTGGAQITWTKAIITSLPTSGVTQAVLGGQVATEINSLKNSVKTVVYQSAEPTSGLVNNLVWVG